MDIRDIRIGDMLQDKVFKLPMEVVAIFKTGLVYLDYESSEGEF